MDVTILTSLLRPMFTVTYAWTSDINNLVFLLDWILTSLVCYDRKHQPLFSHRIFKFGMISNSFVDFDDWIQKTQKHITLKIGTRFNNLKSSYLNVSRTTKIILGIWAQKLWMTRQNLVTQFSFFDRYSLNQAKYWCFTLSLPKQSGFSFFSACVCLSMCLFIFVQQTRT